MRRFAKELYGFLVVYMAQRRLRAALPAVFEQVDEEFPELLFSGTPYKAERLIARAIKEATGRKASKLDVLAVSRLYSPIEAVRHKPRR